MSTDASCLFHINQKKNEERIVAMPNGCCCLESNEYANRVHLDLVYFILIRIKRTSRYNMYVLVCGLFMIRIFSCSCCCCRCYCWCSFFIKINVECNEHNQTGRTEQNGKETTTWNNREWVKTSRNSPAAQIVMYGVFFEVHFRFLSLNFYLFVKEYYCNKNRRTISFRNNFRCIPLSYSVRQQSKLMLYW